jgi:hypothetical protein
MTTRHICVLALALSVCPLTLAQSRWPRSDPKELRLARCAMSGKTLIYPVGKYKVKLVSSPDDESVLGQSCSAYLVKPDGTESLLHQDADIAIFKGTGENIFGDGDPGLILEGFSGCAHGCLTYVLADLGDAPVVFKKIENGGEFYIFEDSSDGKYKILTWDGAFDYFDDFCHACSPVPTVVLELQGTSLRDVSAEFIADYDEVIADAKAKISPNDLNVFLANPGLSKNDQAWTESEEIRRAILEVVLAYLYSGREQAAWQTLDQMWPANDRLRIKNLILKTRSEGILSQIEAVGSPAKRKSSSVP